jgi:hypothetical protein
MNLFIICGVWDLIIWNSIRQISSTEKNDAVIYSKAFDKQSTDRIEIIARELGFSTVQYADKSELIKNLAQKKYYRVFALHLSDSLTREICIQSSEATLHFGFEGLAAYFPPRIHPAMHARIKTYYHFGSLPAPLIYSQCQKIDIPKDKILASVNSIKKILNLQSPFVGQPLKNYNILLGQHFYRQKLIDWEDELDAYSDYVGEKIKNGQQVLWKEHPRSSIQFGPWLKKKWGSSFHICNIDPLYSVELFGDELKDSNESAGFCSNSLFNLRDFFSNKINIITNNDSLHKFNFGNINRLALIHFTGIAYANGDGKVSVESIIGAFGYNERALFSSINNPPKSNKRDPSTLFSAVLRLISKFVKLFKK